MIIDAHLHLAEAGSPAEKSLGKSALPIDALRQMDAAGIDAAVVLGLPGLQTPEEVLRLCSVAKDRFFPLMGINPASSADVAMIAQARERGFYGLKVHPRLSQVAVNDPRWEAVLRQAEAHELTVLFDAVPQSTVIPMMHMNYLAFDVLAKQYPKVQIILAHACAPDVLGGFVTVKANKNVYLDMSFSVMYYQGSSLDQDMAFVSDQIDRFVLYGSDYPMFPADQYLKAYQALIASRPGVNRSLVFAGNAIKLFKLPLTA
ncbi:MAG: amidohydrolase family protein [Gemmatales bacterium]